VANVVHVTRTGANVIADRLKTQTTYTTEPKNIAWGTGGTGTETAGGAPPFTAAITDVGMFQESAEARVAGTSSITTTTTTNDTYTVTGTITSAGTQTITECGLFDSTTKPAATTLASPAIAATGTTTLNLASSAGFATVYPYDLQVGVEVMQVSNLTGVAITMTRGNNGSTAQSVIPVGEIITQGVAPGQTVIAGNVCFLHASFTGLALNINDSIAFTINTAFAPQ
jgi:hypothetical protein